VTFFEALPTVFFTAFLALAVPRPLAAEVAFLLAFSALEAGLALGATGGFQRFWRLWPEAWRSSWQRLLPGRAAALGSTAPTRPGSVDLPGDLLDGHHASTVASFRRSE
jgi:hypothetical protein